jgi:hypothetical protein
MALIEVEDGDYNLAVSAKTLLDKMSANPKLRRNLLSMVKEMNPNASIPELDANAPLHDALEAFKAEVGGSIKDLKEQLSLRNSREVVDNVIATERAKLKKAGWDDEGIGKIEARMQAEGLAHYGAAAALVEKDEKVPEAIDPVSSYDRGWHIAQPETGDDGHALLLKNPKAYQDQQIRAFFNEKRAMRA